MQNMKFIKDVGSIANTKRNVQEKFTPSFSLKYIIPFE